MTRVDIRCRPNSAKAVEMSVCVCVCFFLPSMFSIEDPVVEIVRACLPTTFSIEDPVVEIVNCAFAEPTLSATAARTPARC